MGNVFNRYGAGGGKSEGLYIWKKSNCISGKTFKLTSTSGSRIYTISEAEFNLSLINENNYIDFFKDFKMNTVNYFVVENGKLNIHEYTDGNTILEYRNDGTFYATNRVAPKSFTYSMTRDNVYVTDFIDYVISDKEDAYPDKAEKDGYYYEKVKYDSSMFGGDKVVAGTITPTSNARSISISNTVGTIPKLLMIESANQSSYFNYGLWIFDNTGVNGVTGYCSGSTGYMSSASGTANATTITPMVKNTSSHYFQANTKLAYVVVY